MTATHRTQKCLRSLSEGLELDKKTRTRVQDLVHALDDCTVKMDVTERERHSAGKSTRLRHAIAETDQDSGSNHGSNRRVRSEKDPSPVSDGEELLEERTSKRRRKNNNDSDMSTAQAPSARSNISLEAVAGIPAESSALHLGPRGEETSDHHSPTSTKSDKILALSNALMVAREDFWQAYDRYAAKRSAFRKISRQYHIHSDGAPA